MTDVHTLAGAYALDAVTDIERAAFRRHLDQCETCTLEVAELSETAARLTDATWTEPPPELREAVLAQVARTPQARPGRVARSRGVASAGWRRWTVTAVAASVLAAAAGGAVYVVQEQRVQEQRDRLAQIEAIVTAPDASVRSEPAGEAGTVTVIGSRARDEAVVMLDALPEPRDDQAYELWLSVDDRLTSAGVLAAGTASATMLITGYGDADAVGVSLEQAGGSPTGEPTSDQVLALLTVD
jgi:anti-sigma-K factor RskA